MNSKVDDYLKQPPPWQAEIKKLRKIILACNLNEELKWGKPCYSFQGSNLVIIIPMKERCALMFCKGALLKDPKKILGKVGENTQASRWINFTNTSQITELESVLKAYIQEAIEAEKSGLKVAYKTISEYAVPEELQNKFRENPALKKAFKALTPGRQKAYLLYFSGAKQSKTRETRIEKCMSQILKGGGLND